jgi:hypothetical protein
MPKAKASLVANKSQVEAKNEVYFLFLSYFRGFLGLKRQFLLYSITMRITSSTDSRTISFFPVVVLIMVSGVDSTNSIKSALITTFSL